MDRDGSVEVLDIVVGATNPNKGIRHLQAAIALLVGLGPNSHQLVVVHVCYHKSVSGSNSVVSKVVQVLVVLRIEHEGFDEEVVSHNVVVQHFYLRLARVVELLQNQVQSSILIDIKECDELSSVPCPVSDGLVVLQVRPAKKLIDCLTGSLVGLRGAWIDPDASHSACLTSILALILKSQQGVRETICIHISESDPSWDARH